MNRVAKFSVLLLLPWGACTPSGLNNLQAPTVDFSSPIGLPVPRTISVGFINNTPFRAIFTFGAYDPLDDETVPTGFGQLRLEGNSASTTQLQPCRKVFSVGDDELIKLLDTNRNDPQIDITDERALVRGVNFSSAPLGDPLEAEPTEGTAEPKIVQNGIDFTCVRKDIRETTGTGLLLFTFVQDPASVGGFRIDFSFVAP